MPTPTKNFQTILFCYKAPSQVPPDTAIVTLGESPQSLNQWFISTEGKLNFFETTKDFFLKWAAEGDFLGSATWKGWALLGPLRWGFFLQFKARIERIEMIRHLLKKLGPKSVKAEGLEKENQAILQKLCEEANIPFNGVEAVQRQSRLQKLKTPGALYRYSVILFNRIFIQKGLHQLSKFLYSILGLLKFLILRSIHPHPELFFLSANSHWLKVGENGKFSSREILLEKFIADAETSKTNYWILTLMDGPELALKALFTQPLRTIPFDGIKLYFRLFHKAELEAENQNTRISFEHWDKNQSLFVYQGVDLKPFVLSNISSSGAKIGMKWAEEAVVFESLLKRFSPKKIILTGEMSNWIPAVIAANFHDIKTVGVSHAVIYPYRMEYLYSSKEKLSQIPRCTELAVWGDYEKELVSQENGFYEPGTISVIGYPKFLRVPPAPNAQTLVRRKLGIENSLPLAICTSNNRYHGFAKKFLESWKEVKEEVHLIVKLHPRELNERQYNYWARHFGIKNFTIVRDFDLLLLLQACEMHLSFSSTTIMEAAYLGKPTLVFDDGLKQDPLEVVKMGVAYFLSDFKSVKEAIRFLQRVETKEAFEASKLKFVQYRLQVSQTSGIFESPSGSHSSSNA